MSPWTLAATVLSSLLGGGVVVALITWRRFRPQDKAQTAKLAADTRGTDADTISQLIGDLRDLVGQVSEQGKKIAHLEHRLSEQGDQIAALQRRNRDLREAMRSAVAELLAWIRRALTVMTPDQQQTVGPAPDYQHLVTVKEGQPE